MGLGLFGRWSETEEELVEVEVRVRVSAGGVCVGGGMVVPLWSLSVMDG